VTGARRRGVALLLATCVLAGLGLAAIRGEPTALRQRPAAERPALLLLTSLPLLFGEDFSLRGGGSPVLKALQGRYRVLPISVTDSRELAKGRLLLMAQPLAQTAENLVALDGWVRHGGHVLLLADPTLEWPSKRPLGDPLRPPPMFQDTGLLAHWGLRLDTPEQRGRAERRLGGRTVLTVSPGTLWGRCEIGVDRLAAHCKLAKGEAVVVADADLLDIDRLARSAKPNLEAVLEELATLERSDSQVTDLSTAG
jgi:hypothetical protein